MIKILKNDLLKVQEDSSVVDLYLEIADKLSFSASFDVINIEVMDDYIDLSDGSLEIEIKNVEDMECNITKDDALNTTTYTFKNDIETYIIVIYHK